MVSDSVILAPTGASENSPAFQRLVENGIRPSPVGGAPVLTLNLYLSDEHPEITIKSKIMIKNGADSLLDSNSPGG